MARAEAEPPPVPSEPPIEEQFGVPRCRNCYYVLENLPEPRCPECGTPFDFDDPDTYTIKPPFVRWKLWLPGLLLALGGGMALYLFIVPFTGFGFAATLLVPASAGAIIGYSCRVRTFLIVMVSIITLSGLLFGCLTVNYAGLLCGLMLAGIALGPLTIGTIAGMLLRLWLKRSQFDQRWHLPLIAFLLLPVIGALVEWATDRPAPLETVQTSMVMDAPIERAWASIQFYEEVKHGPPPLLRLGMPLPLYTIGRAAVVGDLKTCVYDKGRLTKRITAVEPRRRLAFRVVEQGFEQHAMTLSDGGFDFAPFGDDADRSQVTLTTTYRSHLGPRWCWRPFERFTVHTLHRHVLRGMKEEAKVRRDDRASNSFAAAGREAVR
jgi:hypothetical protein